MKYKRKQNDQIDQIHIHTRICMYRIGFMQNKWVYAHQKFADTIKMNDFIPVILNTAPWARPLF